MISNVRTPEFMDPYEGTWEARVEDFLARIRETDFISPTYFAQVVASHLADLAVQHIEDLDGIEAEVADTLRRRFSNLG